MRVARHFVVVPQATKILKTPVPHPVQGFLLWHVILSPEFPLTEPGLFRARCSGQLSYLIALPSDPKLLTSIHGHFSIHSGDFAPGINRPAGDTLSADFRRMLRARACVA